MILSQNERGMCEGTDMDHPCSDVTVPLSQVSPQRERKHNSIKMVKYFVGRPWARLYLSHFIMTIFPRHIGDLLSLSRDITYRSESCFQNERKIENYETDSIVIIAQNLNIKQNIIYTIWLLFTYTISGCVCISVGRCKNRWVLSLKLAEFMLVACSPRFDLDKTRKWDRLSHGRSVKRPRGAVGLYYVRYAAYIASTPYIRPMCVCVCFMRPFVSVAGGLYLDAISPRSDDGSHSTTKNDTTKNGSHTNTPMLYECRCSVAKM